MSAVCDAVMADQVHVLVAGLVRARARAAAVDGKVLDWRAARVGQDVAARAAFDELRRVTLTSHKISRYTPGVDGGDDLDVRARLRVLPVLRRVARDAHLLRRQPVRRRVVHPVVRAPASAVKLFGEHRGSSVTGAAAAFGCIKLVSDVERGWQVRGDRARAVAAVVAVRL